MRFLLTVSVALNLLLVATFVAARVSPRGEAFGPGAVSMPEPGSAAIGMPGRFDGSAEYLISLLDELAVSPTDSKHIVLAYLRARTESGRVRPAAEYWQADFAPQAAVLARRIELESSVRDALVGIYGSGAERDPAFASVFRPLGAAYDFLSFEAQLAVQRRQLELLSVPRSPAVANSISPDLCNAADSRRQPVALPPSGISELLSPEDQREFELRFSSLADQLRAIGAGLDETMFRTAFSLAVELQRDVTPEAQAGIRSALRELLGDHAFDRFWAQRDPFFPVIAEHLRAQGVAEQQLFAAYAIINQTQDALLELIAGSGNEEQRFARVRALKAQEQANLAGMLGAGVADSLTAVIERTAMRLGNGGSTRC